MTISTVKLGAVTIECMDVTDVVITDAEEDPEEGGYYVREVRVYGEPTIGSTNKPLIATLRLKAMEQTSIDVTAPAQEF